MKKNLFTYVTEQMSETYRWYCHFIMLKTITRHLLAPQMQENSILNFRVMLQQLKCLIRSHTEYYCPLRNPLDEANIQKNRKKVLSVKTHYNYFFAVHARQFLNVLSKHVSDANEISKSKTVMGTSLDKIPDNPPELL